MSEYHEIKTEYRDKDELIAALNEVGYKVVEDHEIAQSLYGYHGDRRKDTANIIVRRQYVGSAANDLGFIKKADGTYGAIVSVYDQGKHNKTWFDGLKKVYSEKVGRKTAEGLGFQYLGEAVVNGKKQIQYGRVVAGGR